VNNATAIYSDDNGLASFAKQMGIDCIDSWDLPKETKGNLNMLCFGDTGGSSYESSKHHHFRMRHSGTEQYGRARETRLYWTALKNFAGSGQGIGFAQYWVPNPDDPSGNPHHSLAVQVYQDGAVPDVYPLLHPNGIVKTGDKTDPDFETIITKLREAATMLRDDVAPH